MWKHKNFINLQLCAGETWVLNEKINSFIRNDGYTTSFVCDSVSYSWFGGERTSGFVPEMLKYDDTLVYMGGSWENQKYRTVTFATPPTGDLLTWLQANGTKQSTPTLTFKHFYDAVTIGSGTYKFRHYSQTEPLPQLATPQNVSASGATVSWDAVENATGYEILVSGSSFGTVSTTSVDLSTLSGWASLTDGEYSVTIVAKADGYGDSEPSAAVSVTKTSGFTLQLSVYHLGRQAFVKKDGTATPTDYDYYYQYGDEGIKTISGINAYITVLNERGDAVYFYDKVNCSSSGDGSSLATLTLNSDASARLELSD